MSLLQGDRLQEVVSQLQAAVHPVIIPTTSGPLAQQELRRPIPPKQSSDVHTVNVIKEEVQTEKALLPKPKPDSSADDELLSGQ